MPRMIWGLNQDGMHTARSQVGPAQSQPTPHKVAPRSAPLPVVPPRFSKAKEQVQVISHSQRPPTISRPNPHPTSNIVAQNSTPRRQDIHEQVQLKQVLSGHGPIDLSSVLRPRSTHSHLYDSAPAPQDDSFYESFHYGTHNYHGNIEGGSEWRSIQGPSKTSSQYIGTPSEEDLAEYLKPSMSTSSSLASLSSLASSHSMSTIESPIMDLRYRSGQAQAQELNAPHRMSALEIAQKYRQQQLKQGQHMLPTPPSSSSPLWSSRLSPYQGSLASPYSDLGLSPELAMSSNLPAIINYLNQTNLQHLQRQSENPLRTFS
ncbi:hypothetical protein QCA50_009543 [Cerrena zonata]|uniref:Uncharacterized protein n=1 Tax=Cerrena zonata TaxID=2478898 RepID=A0AAW0G154_9APHY